jgi:paraquat-inducible protein B
MSKKTNPTLIGAFVLGAIAIAVAAVVFFGSMKFFTQRKKYITFFEQSVAGLQVGSSVKFKGVAVGQVTKIFIRFRDTNQEAPLVGIIFEIDSDLVRDEDGSKADIFDERITKQSIDNGLRTTLANESFITGLLYLQMDFHDKAPEPEFHSQRKLYTEIPSMSSGIQAIVENATKAVSNLGEVDFKAIAGQLQDLLVTLKTSLSQVKFDELNASLIRTADSFSSLANSPELKNTLANLQEATAKLSLTLDSLRNQMIDPLSKQLTPTLAEAQKTLAELRKTAAQLTSTLSPEGELRPQLNSTLSQLGQAAQSLQHLSEFLERNPSSLIFGRKQQQAPAEPPVAPPVRARKSQP